jgi:DNA polymerase elongation subunit (family B)
MSKNLKMSGFLSFNSLKHILFLDIETVSLKPTYLDLDDSYKKQWAKKVKQFTRSSEGDEKDFERMYALRSGIYAEFSRIICISVGFFTLNSKKIESFRVKSFFGEDEKVLLNEFNSLLEDHFNQTDKNFLCGHNLREFDIPFLCRRMLINNIQLPRLLKLTGKRPWQIKHVLDTLDLWRFGDFKNYTSLDLMANVFNIPSPKDDIDGSQVHEVYWQTKDLDRIRKYCERDVATVARLILKLNSMDSMSDFKVVSKSSY